MINGIKALKLRGEEENINYLSTIQPISHTLILKWVVHFCMARPEGKYLRG